MSSDWYQLWEEDLERRLRRKGSRVSKMAPDLLQALRKDLADIASGPPQVAHRVVPVNPKTGEITKADREFEGEIGLDLGATPTERPRRGRKRKPVPPSARLTEI